MNEESAPATRSRGVVRRTAHHAIYLTTGGLILSSPAIGVFTLVGTILAAVMLNHPAAGLPEQDIVPARAALIVLACLIGLSTVILCFFFGRLHRSRSSALMNASVPKPPRARWNWQRVLMLGLSAYGLRMLAYQLLGLLWGPVIITVVMILLAGGAASALLGLQMDSSMLLIDMLFIGLGTGLLLGAPWILYGLASVDLALVKWVNGVNEKATLAQRVQQVTEARSGVVAAADAERRRIERNLHDGAQQRLTALAVHLGIERSRHVQAAASGEPVNPRDTQAAFQHAQAEVQAALQEIRDLVRGLHPAVLEDRGLDAAVSGVASRAPFPVAVSVDVPERPSLDVEAVAYFVVSEAVNNIIAHAQARHASVTVRRAGPTLDITVEDDGVGGADEVRGTGLTGLRQRVESVDGTLRISSGAEHGTQIRAELPCA